LRKRILSTNRAAARVCRARGHAVKSSSRGRNATLQTLRTGRNCGMMPSCPAKREPWPDIRRLRAKAAR
jgi:hypothetical protein